MHFAPLVLSLAAPAFAAQATPSPLRTVVRDVRTGLAEDAPRATLVLEGGRITAVLAPDAEEPPAARVVEGEGRIAVPAFVDAFSGAGFAAPKPVAERDVPVPYDAGPRIDMRAANRKGLQPAFRVVDALESDDDTTKAWREAGFGALLCAPRGELLAGDGALVVTRDAAPRDRVLAPVVAAHAAFKASGEGYPSTTMAYLAQLRQFFLDARRQELLEERFADGRPGERPPFDADLRAALPLLERSKRVFCEADRADDIRRWLRLADEVGLSIGIVGGREAWRVADELAARGAPVVLTLDWGEEIEDPHAKKDKKKGGKGEEKTGEGEIAAEEAQAEGAAGAVPEPEPAAAEEEPVDTNLYVEPMALREERRRLWLEGRDCALRLAEKGVPFSFGSAALKPGELLKRVRTLVEAGLSRDAALAALTSTAAAQLDVGSRLGALEVGRDATLALWTADPFDKKSKLARLFLDGFEHEFDLEADDADAAPPDEGVDASGEWTLSYSGGGETRGGSASLTMDEDGAVTGTLRSESPDGSMLETEVEGRVSGSTLTLRGTFETGSMSIDVRLEAELEGDTLSGESVGKAEFGEFTRQVSGTRTPQEVRR